MLLDSLLLYEKLYIPTTDFICLPILAKAFGDRAVIGLLERGDIVLVRLHGVIVLDGASGTIKYIHESKRDGVITQPFESTANAIRQIYQSIGMLTSLSKIDPHLINAAEKHTKTIELNEIINEIRSETENDIFESNLLKNVAQINRGKIKGLPENKIRLFSDDPKDWDMDEADHVIRVAMANTEIKLAELSKCNDINTCLATQALISAKIKRIVPTTNQGSFLSLKQMNNIPNIYDYIYSLQQSDKSKAFEKLMKIKHSGDGESFRTWFHQNCSNSPNDAAKNYTHILKTVPLVDRLPVRVLRFAIVTAIAFAQPFIGVAAGAIDNFAVSRFFRGSSPKFFFEKLRKSTK